MRRVGQLSGCALSRVSVERQKPNSDNASTQHHLAVNLPMLLAFIVVTAAAAFLGVLGAVSLLRPPLASRFLLGFAESAAKHYTELALRLTIGAALGVAAPAMNGAKLFASIGWVLLATTAVMLVLPWQTHRTFARTAVPKALAFLPIIGVCSTLAGLATLWALYGDA
jgi:hypothetical protein